MNYFGYLLVMSSSIFGTDSSEVCQWETFEAKCGRDEVIVMTKALYGRMQYGRCVKRDYGYVGCFTEALGLADWRCSGRQECKIGVPDKLFDGTRPCPEDLKLYLEADYKCIKVTFPRNRACIRGGPVAIPTDKPGILASYVTETTGCGSTSAPWKIAGQPGQRWNITLMDFSRVAANKSKSGSGGKSDAPYSHCHVFAIIKEKTLSKSVTVCGGNPNQGRERSIFLSESHQLEIRIMIGKPGKDSGQFLLKYQAVGCPDPVVPRGGWMKREGQSATLGCHQSGNSWRLTCSGHTWSGQGENCTDTSASDFHVGFNSMSSLSRASSMFIVLGVAVIIGVLILIIGLILLKTCVFRRQRVALRNNSQQAPKSKEKLTDKEGLYMTTKGNLDYGHPPLLNRQDPYSTEENEYAYVEEFQFSGPTSCACTTESSVKGSSAGREQSRPGMTMTPYSLLMGDQRLTRDTLKHSKGTGSHGDSNHRYTTAQGDAVRGGRDHPEYFTLEPENKRNNSTM